MTLGRIEQMQARREQAVADATAKIGCGCITLLVKLVIGLLLIAALCRYLGWF